MGIVNFFKNFGKSVAKGDIWVKLSLIWTGAGYAGRKQYVRALLSTILEAIIILFSVLFAPQYISKFDTLGDVQKASVYNPITMKNEVNDYDNSFLILLMSVIILVVWFAALLYWMNNVIRAYELQKLKENGKHINNFMEDCRDMLNHKFHKTLLTLPIIGIILFTAVPILVMIFIAFTNYDKAHLSPTHLFTWVGLSNFAKLADFGSNAYFGYAFRRILIWTFIWAFFATFTNYIGGILMALLINNKKTRYPRLWRTLFVVTIAVPQFVSLLLVRNFFANNGIANTFCSSIGLTDWLNQAGLITTNYIPFLSKPGWAHVMIILINIWVGIPYQMLIATGVLMNIPAELQESARIDGANSRQVFWKITMPYMFVVTGPQLVTDFVRNINNFNVIFLLTETVYTTTNQRMANAKGTETDLLVTWLFSLTQESYNYKMASVIGIVIFVICAIFTLLAFTKVNSAEREEMFS